MNHKHLSFLLALLTASQVQAQTLELFAMSLPELQAKADAGNADALLQLSVRYNYGPGLPDNQKKVKELMVKAAKAGQKTAIGICALNGLECPQDAKKAFEIFKAQSEAGDLVAIRNLGRCYEKGIGCQVDKAKAFEMYQKAAEAKDPGSLYFLATAYSEAMGVEEDQAKATELIEQAADAGCLLARVKLGERYAAGLGCLKDPASAAEQYTQAAEAGSAQGMKKLGGCYWSGAGVSQDYSKAHEWYEKAGAAGDGQALAWLGSDYFSGTGVEKSFTKGEELWMKAARLDFPSILFNLARKYQNGEGIEKDQAKANQLYLQGGELGDGACYHTLGFNYENGNGVTKDIAKANQYYLKAGELGEGVCYRNLGNNYGNGNGVAKDIVKANQYYLKAGELGDGGGYTNLGINYANGNGVAKDIVKANQYYLKAGELGDGGGYTSLGYNYETGNGVTKDLAKANEYYLKGAELGSAIAMHNLGVNLRDGTGIAKDLAKAVEWLKKSADAGYEWGMWNLGKCYSSGRGVKKDMAKAMELFTQAVEKNHPSAAFDLGTCYENGLGVKKDKAKARELYEKAASLGNADAQQRLKDLGPAPKKSATAPAQNERPKAGTSTTVGEVDVLLSQAREALDEEGDFEAALGKAGQGIAFLDEENEAHVARWAHAHATIASALVELAYIAPDENKKQLCQNAISHVDRGAFQMKPQGTVLKKESPDLHVRLIEERARAMGYWVQDKQVSEEETLKGWKIVRIDSGFALGLAKKPLSKARLLMAVADTALRIGNKLHDIALIQEGLEKAGEAMRIAKESKDKDWISRAECVHGLALMALTVSQGYGGAFDSDRIKAKDEVHFAAGHLQKVYPNAPFTLRALKWRDAIEKHSDKVLMGAVLGAVNAVFNTPDSAATTEWNNRLRTMSGANSIARSSGNPPPYPGIP